MATLTDEKSPLDTEDYAAFLKHREPAETTPVKTEAKTVAAEVEAEAAPVESDEETPPSEPADEAGQIAEESDPEEEAAQIELEEQQAELLALQQDKPVVGEAGKRLAKRMRELTGKIKALESQLAERDTPADVAEEATEEVVSSPEPVAAGKAPAPKLSDFEDNQETGQSAWDQYEVAKEAFNDAKTARLIATALAQQKTTLDMEHAKAVSDENWNKAAARFDNYNEVVNAETPASPAMLAVLKAEVDAETGTALAYYLGQHPEESKAIAEATLANNAEQFGSAKIRAAVMLGAIKAKLTAPGKKPELVAKGTTPKTTPTPTPPLKTVTSAKKPPSQIRGGSAPPKFNLLNDTDAEDYGKWNTERTRQLALSGKR